MLNIEPLVEAVEESKDLPVVVEGKRDVRALRKLGFNNIFPLNKPIFAMIEGVSHYKEVIILTDLDTEGKKLYRKLKSGFCERGVQINEKLRQQLIFYKISHIEGLDSFIDSKDFLIKNT